VISEEELSDIVDRFLEVGVPATAVAKALGVDPFVVRDRQNHLRVQQYGAAELSEALANMQWEALAEARAMMYDAPYTVRSRFIMGILSKTMSLTARQSPETIGIMRRQLLEFMSDQGAGGDIDSLAGIDPSAFVSTAPSDEDQNEGSDD
jgi:hypothetical protein